MKKLIFTLVFLVQIIEVSAQKFTNVETYLEMITKYETLAAKSVDDYTISMYQNKGTNKDNEVLLFQIKEDRQLLSDAMFGVHNDDSYTVAMVDFLDTIIAYFESNTTAMNLETVTYEELEENLKLYEEHATLISAKYTELIKLKENFFKKHNLPIKIEYERDVYKNQYFRFTQNYISILSRIDLADLKLDEAITAKNHEEMSFQLNKLNELIASAQGSLNKLGSYKEGDKLFAALTNYVKKYEGFQNSRRSYVNLVINFDNLKKLYSQEGKSENYVKQEKNFNMEKQFAIENNKLMQIEKNNLKLVFDEQLDIFKSVQIEIIIYVTPASNNNNLLSMRKNN